MAKEVASWSKDTSTKVGCIITEGKYFRAAGFNGIPAGLNDEIDERNQRPEKYFWFDHAEINALEIFPYKNAAGCTLYVTHFPCATCARAIIRKQIARIVTFNQEMNNFDKRWEAEHVAAQKMFNEANIKIDYYKNEL